MQEGTIKWFDAHRGYGFIEQEDRGKDVFVHYSSIIGDNEYKSLKEGDKVSFETEQTEKGIQAVNVKIL